MGARLLVGLDGSVTSLRAGAYAVGLARRQGCPITAVYVSDVSGAGLAAGALLEADVEQAAELRAVAEAALERAGVVGEFVHRRGDAYAELVDAAEGLQVDAIVVGASTRLGHRVAGSLAVRLVRHARWPVVVVP